MCWCSRPAGSLVTFVRHWRGMPDKFPRLQQWPMLWSKHATPKEPLNGLSWWSLVAQRASLKSGPTRRAAEKSTWFWQPFPFPLPLLQMFHLQVPCSAGECEWAKSSVSECVSKFGRQQRSPEFMVYPSPSLGWDWGIASRVGCLSLQSLQLGLKLVFSPVSTSSTRS